MPNSYTRKIFLLTLSLTAVFGLTACGDDVSSNSSSTNTSSNTDTSENHTSPDDPQSAMINEGKRLYDSFDQGCLSCHGADGQHDVFKAIDLSTTTYEHSSTPGSRYTLEEYITLWMPVSDPSLCVGSCSESIAAFIRSLENPDDSSTPPPQLIASTSASQNTQGFAPLTVTFDASQSSGNIATYEWNFDDGENGQTQQIDHQYSTPGSYTAQLTVTDNNGNTDTSVLTVTVFANAAPTARINTSAETGVVPITIRFDGNASTDDQGIVNYRWTIADTVINGAVNDYEFTEAGVYDVQLRVTDAQGAVSTANQTVSLTSPEVNIAPVANASASTNLSGPAPLTVNLNASASSDDRSQITAYYWDFEDGQRLSGEEATRTFTSEGEYVVRLTVVDNENLSNQTSLTIRVDNANEAPEAEITALSPTVGLAPYSLRFSSANSSDDEGIARWAWDINGDNQTDSTVANPTFNLTQVGSHNISLSVYDEQGLSDSDSVSVEVLDASVFAANLYSTSCSSCHGADGSGGTSQRPLTQTWEDKNLDALVAGMIATNNANCQGVETNACVSAVASYIVEQFPPNSNEPPVVIDDHLINLPIKALTPDEFYNTIESVFSVSFTDTEKANFNVPFGANGSRYSTDSEMRVLSGISNSDDVLDDLYPALTAVYESVVANLSNSAIQNIYGGEAGCDFSDIDNDEDCRIAYSAAILSKAFRRNVSGNDYALNSVSGAYDIFVFEDPSDAFVKSIVSYTLFSPEFIFHSYRGDTPIGEGYRLTNEELAHKISYLVWGAPADSTLLSRDWNSLLSGENDTALDNELTRLFSDTKSKYFIDTFLKQWLKLETDVEERLNATSDSARASEYVQAIKGESEHFMRYLITQNESINSIINANYTFMNATLADYYGVSNTGLGSEFTRVDFTSGNAELSNRQGLLTQANFLTTDSKGDRPGTIHRGVTILKEVMCYSIGIPLGEAPEPNGDIIPSTVTESFLFRDSTENNAICSGCHTTINPVSFPFEAFDRFGRHPLALSQGGSLFEYAVYESVGINGIDAADGPTIKDEAYLLDNRGGSIDIANIYGSTISGSYSDHKGLISLIGESSAFGECINDNLYDFIIGTNAERGLNASSPESATQHASQTASKRIALEGTSGIRTLIANLIKRPEFRVIRRN